MFWDRIAGIYDLYQIINRKANDRAAAICAEYIMSEDNVLECACGTGIMTRVIALKSKTITATYVSQQADSSAAITKIFNMMGANFKKEFSSTTYKQFFEEMGIEADYRLAPGVISCCVAIIKV